MFNSDGPFQWNMCLFNKCIINNNIEYEYISNVHVHAHTEILTMDLKYAITSHF